MSDIHKGKFFFMLKTVSTVLNKMWYFPNYLSKAYITKEKYILELASNLYKTVNLLTESSISSNKIYLYTKHSILHVSNLIYENSPPIYSYTKNIVSYVPKLIYENSPLVVQSYLDGSLKIICKSAPNLKEIFIGAVRPSVFKYNMIPLEKAVGDDPNLFSWIMDFTRIATFEDFIEKSVEVSSTGMKYSNLHIESAKSSFFIKASSILGGSFFYGLEKGSLTDIVKCANWVSEPFAKGFIVLAEKKYKLGKENLGSYEFIKENGDFSWFGEIILGGFSRIYVSSKIGAMVAKSGINEASRNLGNEIEENAIKIISNNTVTFNSSDDITIKYTKVIENSESILDQVKWIPAMIPIAFIDIMARYAPYALGGIPLVTITRMTSFSFQKLIDSPSELNGFESTVIGAVSSLFAYEMYNYLSPEVENDDNQVHVTEDTIYKLNQTSLLDLQDEL